MAELMPPRKAQLQTAPRAWINYRGANCAFYDDPDGGTLARVNANACMMTATRSCLTRHGRLGAGPRVAGT